MNTWAVVEVLGHRRHIGWISEVTIAGMAMLAVEEGTEPEDVLDDGTQRPGLRMHLYVPANAVFSVRPLSAAEARAMLTPYRPHRTSALDALEVFDTGDLDEVTQESVPADDDTYDLDAGGPGVLPF